MRFQGEQMSKDGSDYSPSSPSAVSVLPTGWTISSCLTRQYHYVDEPMTWTEAQTYCREKYTDLATIENMEDMDKILSAVSSSQSDAVWIGLYSNIEWKWSTGEELTTEAGTTAMSPTFIKVISSVSALEKMDYGGMTVVMKNTYFFVTQVKQENKLVQ